MDSSISSSGLNAKNGQEKRASNLLNRSLNSYLEKIFMTDESTPYIVTPQTTHRPERIDTLLEKRMKQFLLARRRKLWQEQGV
jgi:hypothetical protein